MTSLIQQILNNIQGLPEESLQEILDFAEFIKQKKLKENATDDISTALSALNHQAATHLEEETADSK